MIGKKANEILSSLLEIRVGGSKLHFSKAPSSLINFQYTPSSPPHMRMMLFTSRILPLFTCSTYCACAVVSATSVLFILLGFKKS